ncbi:MAG: VOC family protein [Rhodovulum sp.]
MAHPVLGIDHCFVLVNDLDAAAAQYAALGFTLSPRGLHSAAKGTANYTIMFPEDYLELLGVLTPTEGNAPRRAMLDRCGQGLHAIACRIGTAEAAARDLADLGIGTQGLGSFERPVPLPGGGEGIAAFSTVSFAPEEVPFGMVFMCQHRTPETVWLPELLDHPNTACGLDAILALSDDPGGDAARFARLWAEGEVDIRGGAHCVRTGPHSAPLILMDGDGLAAAYPGVDLGATAQGAFAAARVKVRDLRRAEACLNDAGIAGIPTGHGLAVPPQRGAGCIVEFVPA